MDVEELAEFLGHELPAEPVHSCGYPEDSFACRIRHIQMNTGAAKAAND